MATQSLLDDYNVSLLQDEAVLTIAVPSLILDETYAFCLHVYGQCAISASTVTTCRKLPKCDALALHSFVVPPDSNRLAFFS